MARALQSDPDPHGEPGITRGRRRGRPAIFSKSFLSEQSSRLLATDVRLRPDSLHFARFALFGPSSAPPSGFAAGG